MNNKGGANFSVIGYNITLDEILEANNVGNCFLAVPDLILVAWNSTFLSDHQTTTITGHDERVAGPKDLSWVCCRHVTDMSA